MRLYRTNQYDGWLFCVSTGFSYFNFVHAKNTLLFPLHIRLHLMWAVVSVYGIWPTYRRIVNTKRTWPATQTPKSINDRIYYWLSKWVILHRCFTILFFFHFLFLFLVLILRALHIRSSSGTAAMNRRNHYESPLGAVSGATDFMYTKKRQMQRDAWRTFAVDQFVFVDFNAHCTGSCTLCFFSIVSNSFWHLHRPPRLLNEIISWHRTSGHLHVSTAVQRHEEFLHIVLICFGSLAF